MGMLVLVVILLCGAAWLYGRSGRRTREGKPRSASMPSQSGHQSQARVRRVGYKTDRNINLDIMTTLWAGDCDVIEFTSHGNRLSAVPQEVYHNPDNKAFYLRAYFPDQQESIVFRLSSLETKILMRSKRYTQEEWLRKVIGDELYDSVAQGC